MDGVWAGGREKVCLRCISETVRCRKLILGTDIGLRGVELHSHGVTLVSTFDLAVVTLTYKIMFRLYLGNL